MASEGLAGIFRRKTPWERFVPMTREQAKEILKRDMPPDTTVWIDVTDTGRGDITIKSNDIDESRTFDLETHLLDTGFMELNSQEAKGKGLGRHIMRNEIEFFRACGVKRFHIYAALGNGGYTWARLGFLPENTSEYRAAQSKVWGRLEKLAPLLTADEKRDLNEIVQFKNPRDIWRLADIKIDIRERLATCFNKAAAGDIGARAIRRDILEMHKDIDTQIKSKKELPIGRVLLAGTSWYGNLHFDDAEQMARVEKYVGGWIGVPEAQKQPEPTNDNDQQLSSQPSAQATQAEAARARQAENQARQPPSLVERFLNRLGL